MSSSNKETNKSTELTTLQGAAFLFGTTAFAALGGFGIMFARARKKSPNEFYSGPDTNIESGARLATRALGRATLYSVSGFTLFCLVVWKALGVHNMKEFSAKMQSFMPRVSPENAEPEEINWEEIFKGNKSKPDNKDV